MLLQQANADDGVPCQEEAERHHHNVNLRRLLVRHELWHGADASAHSAHASRGRAKGEQRKLKELKVGLMIVLQSE